MNKQSGIKEVMDFVLTEYHPNILKRKPLITVDYAQMTEIVNNGERLDVSGGRGNARLLSFDHSKTVEVNVTLPLVDLKMLALISGDEITKKIEALFKRETMCVIVDENTGEGYIELTRKPLEKSVYLYVLEGNRSDGEAGKPLDELPSTDLKDNEFYVDANNRKIIVSLDTFKEGEEVVVYYHTDTVHPVTKLRVDPTKFPKAVSVFGETLWRDQYTEEDEVYNVRIHKARIRPEYTLSMSATDVAVLELTMDVYAFREKCTGRETYIEYIADDDLDFLDGEEGGEEENTPIGNALKSVDKLVDNGEYTFTIQAESDMLGRLHILLHDGSLGDNYEDIDGADGKIQYLKLHPEEGDAVYGDAESKNTVEGYGIFATYSDATQTWIITVDGATLDSAVQAHPNYPNSLEDIGLLVYVSAEGNTKNRSNIIVSDFSV